MVRHILALSTALFLLTGFALAQTREGSGDTPPPAESRIWDFYDGSAENIVSLAYATPETDDEAIVFWCNPGVGTIKLAMHQADETLKAGDPVTYQFIVGSKAFAKTGKLVENEMDGMPSIEADIEAADPFFTSLRAAKDFSIAFDKSVDTFPGPAAELDKLTTACAQQKNKVE